MPRIVRNSWVDIDSSAREKTIGTGPIGKDGTLTAKFKVREDGSVVDSVTVETYVKGNEHVLKVSDPEGNVIFRHVTQLGYKGVS